MPTYIELQYGGSPRPVSTYPMLLVEMLIDRCCGGFAPQNVLDVGPGSGDFTAMWAWYASKVVTVDRESVFPDTVLADLETESWAHRIGKESQDLVFQKSVIEHIRHPWLMLNEMHEVLRPGGRVIVMSPDWRTYMKTFYEDYTHVRPYDQHSLSDVLKASGFQDVTCERIYQYPPLWGRGWRRPIAWMWRQCVPVEASLWLSKHTGIGFFRWSSQLTLLATGIKPV